MKKEKTKREYKCNQKACKKEKENEIRMRGRKRAIDNEKKNVDMASQLNPIVIKLLAIKQMLKQ